MTEGTGHPVLFQVKHMRLFVAVEFSEKIKDTVAAASDELRRLSQKGTFPKRDAFHITLEFLGETEQERVEEIKSAINEAAGEAFRLYLSGAGAFAGKDGAIWWVGTEPSRELTELQKRLHSQLERRGFTLERRAFKPHVTIGRKVKSDADDLKNKISSALGRVSFEVKEIALMESTLRREGPIYKKIYGKELS